MSDEDTDHLLKRVKELEESLDAILTAWGESWDCSFDPGHSGMDEPMRQAHQVLKGNTG